MRWRLGAALAACWAAPALAGLLHRPLLPIDETRYLAVAWQMHRGSWLVPHLNGQPYSDKPPLLFWLIDAGWRLLGVHEWWARLVPLLSALACLLLVRRLARRLWPAREAVAWLAPVLMLGALFWGVLQQLVLFDMLLTAFVLLAVTGAVEAWHAPHPRAWMLVAAGMGFGVLTKGPVALLHVLPLLLLAPWWMRDARPARWAGWYGGVIGAVAGGALVALAWAVPAAKAGGPDYAQMIFLRQTADRMVSSFAHRRPVWWYVPLLPVLLLPWSLWPPLWRAFGRLRASGVDSGVRLCLAWTVPVFIAFSLISGKQVHYLLPLVPALALLAARQLDGAVEDPRRLVWLPAIVFALAGLALLLSPRLSVVMTLAPWLAGPVWPALLLVVLGVSLFVVLRRVGLPAGAVAITTASTSMLMVLQMGVMPRAAPANDMRPVGLLLRSLERDGFELAHAGRYAGQYDFAGRLVRPLVVLPKDSVSSWLAAAPRRAAVVYRHLHDPGLPKGDFVVLLARPYRQQMVLVLASSRPVETATRWAGDSRVIVAPTSSR